MLAERFHIFTIDVVGMTMVHLDIWKNPVYFSPTSAGRGLRVWSLATWRVLPSLDCTVTLEMPRDLVRTAGLEMPVDSELLAF